MLLQKEAERCRGVGEVRPVSGGRGLRRAAGRLPAEPESGSEPAARASAAGEDREDESIPLLLRRQGLAAAGGGGALRGEIADARDRPLLVWAFWPTGRIPDTRREV